MAARLCFAWGIEDVEAWIEKTPSSVLDFWTAFDRIEPIGQQWRQTAEILELIWMQIANYFAEKGIECPARDWESFMPPRFKRIAKPVQVEPQSVDEIGASIRNIAKGL